MVIVSACLLGVECKYNGGNNDDPQVRACLAGRRYVAVCPEVAAGLAPPRPPSEIRDGRVYGKDGRDLTEEFREGAQAAYDEARAAAEATGEPLELAILKARSPSCGVGTIYDGTFTGTRVPGDGFFARLLRAEGIRLITEEDC